VVDEASTAASDPVSNHDSKSTVATSDDGKSQPEDSMEALYILRFTRCPREFRDALLEGPLLQDCQETMKSAGLQAEMTTGSKIFCKPRVHSNAMEAVKSTFPNLQDSLRPYHVIVTEEFRPAVLKVVNGLPRGLKVKCKEESVIARISDAQWVSVECTCLDRLPRRAPQPEEASAEPRTGTPEAPASDERKPTKAKKAKKAKATKAASFGQDSEIGPLFDDLLLPSFPLAPMDPALAFSFMNNAMFPAVLPEPDWSSSYLLRQAMEEQQAMLTHAIACNLHAQRAVFEGMAPLPSMPQTSPHDGALRLDRL
jgi:hypothetical protein